VKPDSRILVEELANRQCLVSGEVVQDDVNLLPGPAQGDDLFEKGNKLAAGVACGGFAVYTTGGSIQRRIR
jgi:hypothetical protein